MDLIFSLLSFLSFHIKIVIKFGKFVVSKNGYKNPKINNSKLDQYMKNKVIKRKPPKLENIKKR